MIVEDAPRFAVSDVDFSHAVSIVDRSHAAELIDGYYLTG